MSKTADVTVTKATKKADKPANTAVSFMRMFKTDDTATEGRWVDYGPSRLKIAKFNNPNMIAAEIAHREPFAEELETIEDGSIRSNQIHREIRCRAMAETVLLDWDNVADENNEPVVYTPELGFMYLMELDEFFSIVFGFSFEAEKYLKYRVEDAAKN